MEEEVKKLEEELEEQLAAAQKMLVERQEASKEIATLKESLKAGDAAEARMNQLTAEIKDWKVKFDGNVAELHATSEQVKKLQKDTLAMQEQLDAASAAKSRAEKARQKAQSELDDVNVQLSNERQTVATLQSKQKVHDKQIAELRQQQDKTAAELEHSQAELREAQTRNLVQRNEIADLEQRAQTAEAAKKRLEAELEEMISAQNDRNMASLERIKRELQVQVDEQKKQLLELEDELQLANDAKMRAEVNNATLKEELRLARENAADSAAVEGLETKVKGLQRQVAELQEDADNERRQRGKLSNEKRKLELDMTSLQDQLDEERK
jgi:myosin protein heavy chain